MDHTKRSLSLSRSSYLKNHLQWFYLNKLCWTWIGAHRIIGMYWYEPINLTLKLKKSRANQKIHCRSLSTWAGRLVRWVLRPCTIQLPNNLVMFSNSKQYYQSSEGPLYAYYFQLSVIEFHFVLYKIWVFRKAN